MFGLALWFFRMFFFVLTPPVFIVQGCEKRSLYVVFACISPSFAHYV